MKLSTLDLNLLLTFEALYLERSVTAAAARLNLGQPAVSGALSRLRKLLADPLFERVGGAMQPSAAAERLAPGVLSALNEVRRALDEHQEFDPQAARTISLGSTDYTSLAVLPGLHGLMEREAPAVQLRVLSYDKDEVGAMVERGSIELALGVFPRAPDRLVRTALFEERFIGVARVGHPALSAGTISLADFVRFPHALVTVRQDARGALDEALATKGLSRQIALTLPHMLALGPVLARSDLLAAMPSRATKLLPAGLTTFRIPLPTPSWRVEMLWNATARMNAGSRWLRDLVKRSVSEASARNKALSSAQRELENSSPE